MIAEDTLQQIIQRFEFIEAQMSEGLGDIAKLAKDILIYVLWLKKCGLIKPCFVIFLMRKA